METHLFRSTALSLALCAAACGAPAVPLVASPRVPAAEGYVEAETDDNGNTKIKLEVKHLARPESIDVQANVYVVWVSKDGLAPQNVGALVVNSDLTGRLETVTPLRSFLLDVTTEAEPAAVTPRGPRVLSAVVRR